MIHAHSKQPIPRNIGSTQRARPRQWLRPHRDEFHAIALLPREGGSTNRCVQLRLVRRR